MSRPISIWSSSRLASTRFFTSDILKVQPRCSIVYPTGKKISLSTDSSNSLLSLHVSALSRMIPSSGREANSSMPNLVFTMKAAHTSLRISIKFALTCHGNVNLSSLKPWQLLLQLNQHSITPSVLSRSVSRSTPQPTKMVTPSPSSSLSPPSIRSLFPCTLVRLTTPVLWNKPKRLEILFKPRFNNSKEFLTRIMSTSLTPILTSSLPMLSISSRQAMISLKSSFSDSHFISCLQSLEIRF